ncbi:hypothetical protein [Roseibacillus persicicus]|uniref:hypothetical protein n=1 Tax=Roseibacillus persicicus TaxID=454148 RepID=UPI00280F48BC|nr:hypothetical protein [Roseibacillus persicicus]MDQ8191436.1 hypothetical protein [Roseibacillus persicicus]
MKKNLPLVSSILLIGFGNLSANPIFLEKGGIVAIEAESTSSRLGDWIEKTDVDDYMGECHLEFTGNKAESGPPESPLKYQFQIKKEGIYELTLRARKRLESKRADISNDCYVAVKGDFESGGEVPLKVLKEDTKMYGGNPDGWGWTRQLDVSHKKYAAQYHFKEGEVYELIIHGRSKNFNFDRILFVHQDVGLRTAWKDNPKESPKAGAATGGSKLKAPPERLLTDKEGRTLLAKLMDKDGDKLTILVKGRSHEIQISDLSEEDQKFLLEWQP